MSNVNGTLIRLACLKRFQEKVKYLEELLKIISTIY